MAWLTVLNDPFNPRDKEIVKIIHGKAVSEYLPKAKDGMDIVVSKNGHIIQDTSVIVRETDHISFVAIPAGGGGGGSDPIRTVAMIALVIAAPHLAGAFAGATAGYVGAGFYGSSFAFAALQVGVIVGGGLLINALMPVAQPSLATNKNLDQISPTYAFDGGSNAAAAGSALPIMLGEARVTPPIIASYLSLDGDKQHLNMLFAVNDGEVDSISDIEINGQPIANFTDVTYSTTSGTADQSVIGNFRNSTTTASLQRGLNDLNAETTYTTAGNTVQEMEVVVSLPKGLFNIKDDGSYASISLEFEIFYRKVGDVDWDYLQGGLYNYYYISDIDGSSVISSTYKGQYYYGPQYYDGYGFITPRYTYSHKSIISGTEAVQKITTVYKTTKRLSYKLEQLPRAQYEVKVVRTSSYSTNTRVANDFALDYVNEIVYDDFIYPGVALLGINALATDQLNGGFPTVTCNVVNIGTDKPKDNPAWACYDLLARNGIPESDIDMDMLTEWAAYCDTKNMKAGLYIDSQQELQGALNMLSLLGRATVVQMGNKFTPIVDKPVAIPTESFLFTSGNILESSFALEYIPYNQRTNVVEVTYYDKTDGYKAKTVQLQSSSYDSSADEIKSSINMYGCCDRQQAADYAQFLLNYNRYITETVSFNASVDSIACNVGDVIKVGKRYMTNTMADGRIVSATDTTVTLDMEVTLEADVPYELQVRLEDDRIIIIDVPALTVQTVTDTLTVNTLTDIPQKYDVYAFGRQDTEATNLYRVVNISRASDFTRKIKAIEYNASVYDDTAVINVEEVVYVDSITNLQATENIVKNNDGSVDELLTLSWVGQTAMRTDIFVNGTKYGQSDSNYFVFKNELTSGQTYTFKVGTKEITYYFTGKSNPPAQVQNVTASSSNGKIYFTWTKNTEIDFLYYKIEINGQVYTAVTNSLTVDNLDTGQYEVDFYAVDTSKNTSLATTYTLDVIDPCLIYMIRDAGLIEKAFIDGIMTIYTSASEPASPNAYDIWKLSTSEVAIGTFTYDDERLSGLRWNDTQNFLYKYFNGSNWVFCSSLQVASIKKMLGQLVSAGANDNSVRVFSVEPYTPYDIGDLWLDGTNINECTTARASGAYVSTDWAAASKEDINIASQIENIKKGA
ncbi:phage tail protein [Sulfurimonas sp. HSL-1716]|uniref:phage tail protein n=1 Tax=Hydrocurvibacter sulfurireducens TaxID=3131937 RepID=UPI0031F90DD3